MVQPVSLGPVSRAAVTAWLRGCLGWNSSDGNETAIAIE